MQMKKQVVALSALLLCLPLVSCKPKAEKEFDIFRKVVKNEINYDGSYSQEIKIDFKQELNYYEGDNKLSKEEALKLGLVGMDIAPIVNSLSSKNVYDKETNTLAKYSLDKDGKEKVKEYYYVENNKEYKCFEEDGDYNFDTGLYEKVKVRKELDNGHINSISRVSEVSMLEVVDEIKTFDEFLNTFTTKIKTIKGAEDYDFSNFKISSSKVDKKYQAIIEAPLKFNVLKIFDIDATAKATLTYNKKNVETLNVLANGKFIQDLAKDGKDYKAISDIDVNLNLSLNKENIKIESNDEINDYKKLEATKAKNADVKVSSILGDKTLTFTEEGVTLPKELLELKNSDLKIYKDEKHTEEIKLESLTQKTFEQTIYVNILPKEGYALVNELLSVPDGFFPINEQHIKEIKISEQASYKYLDKVDVNGFFGPSEHNGKPWTYILLNNEFVTDFSKEIALESGKTYTIDYRFKA